MRSPDADPVPVASGGARWWDPSLATPLLASGGVILAATYARWAVAGGGFAWECRWLRCTGIPCPGCGATRCLAACGHFDLATAWRWHPLVAVLALGLLLWPFLLMAGRMWRITWPERALTRLGRALTPRRIAAGIALNWLYLCWALPR